MEITIQSIEAMQTWPLRKQILRADESDPKVEFFGDYDLRTVHFGAYNNNSLVGIASLFVETQHEDPKSAKQWRLRGMAVLPQFRGKKIGKELVVACEGHVRDAGGGIIWCNARVAALHFYLTLGFKQTMPESFELPGIGLHVRLEKEISSAHEFA